MTSKTATIRDLRYDFAKIEAWLKSGNPIIITRHKKPIALLTSPPKQGLLPPLPDFRERLNRIWGNRTFTEKEVEAMRTFETGEP